VLHLLKAARSTPSAILPSQGGGRVGPARRADATPDSPAPWAGGGKGEGGPSGLQTANGKRGPAGLQTANGKRGPTGLPIRTVLSLVAAGVALAIHFWAWFVSLQYISVARSTLLVSTTPLWAGLGMWALTRRSPSRAFWIGLAVSGVGAWLVTAHNGAQPPLQEAGATVGDGAAILGAIGIAVYFLLVAPHQGPLGTWRVVAWTYPSAAAATWSALLLTGSTGNAMPLSLNAWAAIAALALVPQLIGHTALNWSLKHFTAGAVGAATLLEPVFAGWLAWLILDETPTLNQIVGAAILLAGVALALRSGSSEL